MLLNQLIPNIFELIPHDYAQIRSSHFEKLMTTALQATPSVISPCFYHMLGIPGAGKSTFYHSRSWQPHILIAFDDIMEQIPEYQDDVQTLGSAEAFAKWEIPARVVGYELLIRAVNSRKNIFLDHGGANTAHYNLIKNLPAAGYSTEMHYITCPIELALQRINAREKTTKRHTPEIMVRHRAEMTQKLADQYKRIADRFYIYDNSSDNFVLQETIANPVSSQTIAA